MNYLVILGVSDLRKILFPTLYHPEHRLLKAVDSHQSPKVSIIFRRQIPIRLKTKGESCVGDRIIMLATFFVILVIFPMN